jgi:HD-GYP domain-containing protein (c-di-GMP phosphodiesterase class II)
VSRRTWLDEQIRVAPPQLARELVAAHLWHHQIEHEHIERLLVLNRTHRLPPCDPSWHHHERLDGSGYPDGLHGDDVPLLAQVVGVVDAYEALTTHAPYQPARPVSHAVDVLRGEVERGWRNRDVVETFVALTMSDDQEPGPLTYDLTEESEESARTKPARRRRKAATTKRRQGVSRRQERAGQRSL